jgi:CheY-like chemotaxis protein
MIMAEALVSIIVLVVEDEPLILETLVEVLEEGGYNVARAHSATEAFGVLERQISELGGVITDVNLGHDQPSGWDVARRARELNPDIPVVYMTGDSGHDWNARGVPHSVVLEKPFAPADLVVSLAGLRKIA